MTVTFYTRVLNVPPSPLGLIPAGIIVEHFCNLCHADVATADLSRHARTHYDQEVVATD